MILGIADNHREDLLNYVNWIERLVPVPEWVRLSHDRANALELEHCDGLVLTGGGDVHPRFYGAPDDGNLTRSVDEDRDQFEVELVRRALEAELPLLGICRGMQLVNVALHGSLVMDLCSSGYQEHGKLGPETDRYHRVRVTQGTVLSEIVSAGSGEVNSSHHQAVDRPGKGLRISATSPDGVSEAAEWEDPGRGPFLLLVQWHPERMKESNSPFSQGILQRFADAVHRSAVLHATKK